MNVKSILSSDFAVDGGASAVGARVSINSRLIVWGSLLFSLAFASRSYSFPLAIEIIDTQYTTSVTTWNWRTGEQATPTNSRTMISSVPFSDSLYYPDSGHVEAEANVGLFSISGLTAAGNGLPISPPYRGGSVASVQSQIRFSPLTSVTTTINIQFSGWGQWWCSGGSVSLFDVTSNQEAWNFGWDGSSGTVPWVVTGGDPGATAALALDTDFNAAHTYELTLRAETASNPPDTEHILIQLSGLEPVPEPSTFIFVGLGSLILAMGRRYK
jgi:hypothetical protein